MRPRGGVGLCQTADPRDIPGQFQDLGIVNVVEHRYALKRLRLVRKITICNLYRNRGAAAAIQFGAGGSAIYGCQGEEADGGAAARGVEAAERGGSQGG